MKFEYPRRCFTPELKKTRATPHLFTTQRAIRMRIKPHIDTWRMEGMVTTRELLQIFTIFKPQQAYHTVCIRSFIFFWYVDHSFPVLKRGNQVSVYPSESKALLTKRTVQPVMMYLLMR